MLYAGTSKVLYVALLSALTYGFVALSNTLSGGMDDFRVIDHFLDIFSRWVLDGMWSSQVVWTRRVQTPVPAVYASRRTGNPTSATTRIRGGQ